MRGDIWILLGFTIATQRFQWVFLAGLHVPPARAPQTLGQDGRIGNDPAAELIV